MREKYVTYLTNSARETIDLGRKIGSLLNKGDVVALVGELGSGKTWFTKGLAAGLEVSEDTVVTSPSFALVNEYEGRETLFHMDAYRLDSISSFVSAGLEEYFYEGGVVVLEWANLFPELLPEHTISVEFFIKTDHIREITFSASHMEAIDILKRLELRILKNN